MVFVNANEVTDIIATERERINAQSAKELCHLALEKHPEAEKIHIISIPIYFYNLNIFFTFAKNVYVKDRFTSIVGLRSHKNAVA
jgi:hypothetical protein